ncbi:phosphotransferase family protein [Gordonia sp. (in: high G+C Gram-positive bacteria)]|uniref:phosphotransferase family protein n=1 Tax=Gordonia sp. (in: high G+C Gram-positive bacteria) TaxID=84139 RepID=UPI0039E3A681
MVTGVVQRVPSERLGSALTPILEAKGFGPATNLARTERGFATETYLFTAEDSEGTPVPLVFRRPPEVSLFPDYDLRRQYLVMDRLRAATDLAVPSVRWIDPGDENPLGSPYLVMDQITGGVAPSDFPSYHTAGTYFDADEAGRRQMWFACVDTIAAVHQVDVPSAGLGFLAMPKFGTGALEQVVNYLDAAVHWASPSPAPAFDRAIAWLRDNSYEPEHTTLVWGDARMSNILYSPERTVRGVLDWEIAYLGDHEADLAWMLFLDWACSEFEGHPVLPGTPSREETIAHYEVQTGWRVENLMYNEVLAAVLLAVPLIRMATHLNLGPDVDIVGFCVARIEQLLG